MVTAGIDIGSRTIKLVLLKDKNIVHSVVKPNNFSVLQECSAMLSGLEFDKIIATGYGRHLFADKYKVDVISEIKAFANGVYFVFPNVKTVLDIGGQDTKVISIGKNAKVNSFEMNDKCAAGTGKFLEITAMALKYELDELGELTLKADKAKLINSMCAVFAESEIISLLSQGADRAEISKGIHQSIVNRSYSMLKKVGLLEDFAFVGGVAKNIAIKSMLEQKLKAPVFVPENPQIIGALGCAIVADKSK